MSPSVVTAGPLKSTPRPGKKGKLVSPFHRGHVFGKARPARRSEQEGGRFAEENGEKGGWRESGDGLVSVDRSCLTSARWWRQDGAGEESGCLPSALCQHDPFCAASVPPGPRAGHCEACTVYTPLLGKRAPIVPVTPSPVCRRHETTLGNLPASPRPLRALTSRLGRAGWTADEY